MSASLDRALRLVWLAIGVLLLAGAAGSLLFLGAGLLRNRGATDDAVRIAAEGVPGLGGGRPLRPSAPEAIRGTGTRIVFLDRGMGEGVRAPAPGRRRGAANAVFVDPDGSARLLLDAPAHLREVRFPAPGGDPEVEGWISYEVVGGAEGGPVDPRGGAMLYLSGTDGREFRPVLPEALRYLSHHPFGAGRILVYVHDPSEPERSVRALLYEVEARALRPLPDLDAAFVGAAAAGAR